MRVTFVPHLLPVNRGILSTIYAQAAPGTALEPLRAAYRDFYRAEPFVRVVDKADIKYVKYSNYCDISVQFDERTGTVILISAIDNMVKGAAGQAIQNMNLIFGLEETCGLEMVPRRSEPGRGRLSHSPGPCPGGAWRDLPARENPFRRARSAFGPGVKPVFPRAAADYVR